MIAAEPVAQFFELEPERRQPACFHPCGMLADVDGPRLAVFGRRVDPRGESLVAPGAAEDAVRLGGVGERGAAVRAERPGELVGDRRRRRGGLFAPPGELADVEEHLGEVDSQRAQLARLLLLAGALGA